MTALKEIAKKWGYESVADEDRLVWDKFVSSLHNKALVDRLCCSFKLSLEDVRPQVCIHEDAECKQALLFPRRCQITKVALSIRRITRYLRHRQQNEVVIGFRKEEVTDLTPGEAHRRSDVPY